MPIWVMVGSYEGEMFCSTHFTEKGAALAAIADVLDYLGIDDEDTALQVMNARQGYTTLDGGELTEAIEWDHEKLRKMNTNKLWGVYGEWSQLTWDDDVMYRTEVIRTIVTG